MAVRRAQVYQLKGSTVLYATMASLAIACPLLAMMCFSLFASFTVLLLASPLLVVFAPLIVPAALLLGASSTAFALAMLMAIAGISAFSWIYQSARKYPSLQIALRGIGGRPSMVTEAGFAVKGSESTLSADGQIHK